MSWRKSLITGGLGGGGGMPGWICPGLKRFTGRGARGFRVWGVEFAYLVGFAFLVAGANATLTGGGLGGRARASPTSRA